MTAINLALQGGGAHGAFTWGVLAGLLDDSRIRLDAISGSSAGAINAALLAEGWRKNGNEGAKNLLRDFWESLPYTSPAGFMPLSAEESAKALPGLKMAQMWSQFLTPNQWNPLGINPLKKHLAQYIDLEKLRADSPFKLYLAATRAKTLQLRIFREDELSLDMLLASACLPTLSAPLTIDGEAYWDGGYSANPPIMPLTQTDKAKDILVVLLQPLQYPKNPDNAEHLRQRLVDMSFHSAFLREMQIIAQWQKIKSGFLSSSPLAAIRFHAIVADPAMHQLPALTKLAPNINLVRQLYQWGILAAHRWLGEHGESIGKQSTWDIHSVFNEHHH